jgi:hypothetical protein
MPARRPRAVNCSICGIGSSAPILHFNLTRKARTPDGRQTSRGAGAIDLCQECWRAATRRARIHARPDRAA